jgi:hypothetical protein
MLLAAQLKSNISMTRNHMALHPRQYYSSLCLENPIVTCLATGMIPRWHISLYHHARLLLRHCLSTAMYDLVFY